MHVVCSGLSGVGVTSFLPIPFRPLRYTCQRANPPPSAGPGCGPIGERRVPPQSACGRVSSVRSTYTAVNLKEMVMGLFDAMKIGPKVDKVVELSKKDVRDKAIAKIKGKAEDAAKEALSDVAADVVNEKLGEALGDSASGIPDYVRKKIVEKACEKVVDKVWDEVKDQI